MKKIMRNKEMIKRNMKEIMRNKKNDEREV
jgi:hypothetical protein